MHFKSTFSQNEMQFRNLWYRFSICSLEGDKLSFDYALEFGDQTYEVSFTGRIAESKLTGELESLAGGRVYTGRHALEIGLVDEIGGLREAIAFVSGTAGLDNPDIHLLPEPKDPFSGLFSSPKKPGKEDDFITLNAPSAPYIERNTWAKETEVYFINLHSIYLYRTRWKRYSIWMAGVVIVVVETMVD